MLAQTKAPLLRSLNDLLLPDKDAKAINFVFKPIAEQIQNLKLNISIEEVEEFYNDKELNKIAVAKKNAMEKKALKLAMLLHSKEQELLAKHAENPNFKLYSTHSFFEIDEEDIIAHLNLRIANQRFLKQLIEDAFGLSGLLKNNN